MIFVRIWYLLIKHSGPENLKKSRQNKLMKSNKSISRRNFFDQSPLFASSKMAKNQFLNCGKSLKQPKMQFQEKIDLFDFTSFFPGLF